MSTLVRTGIHFCFQKLIAPRSRNEDARRHEFILNIILVGFITLVTCYGISLVVTYLRIGTTEHQIPIPVFAGFLALFGTLLVLSRKGFFTLSTYLFLGCYFLLATGNAFVFGVELPIVMISYTIIIIISSILVGTRFSIITTITTAGVLITLGYLQVSGITHPNTSWRLVPILINDPIQLSISFGFITLITWLSNREIEASLIRARRSEHDLKIERDNLEITVEDRTREIKALQAEKVAQLYRSAEFGRLASGLFHDLMNPLHALIGTIDHIKSGHHTISEAEHYLTKSIAASRRMGEFLTSIRKQLGRHDIREIFSCTQEITEAVTILTYHARTNNVVLIWNPLQNITLFGNPLKFHQIAVNLIANSIDAYTDETATQRSVEISLVRTQDTVTFTVRDYGCGIPPEIINHIFDPFFTTKEPLRGTGLGLSTTKSVVESDFSGTITAASTLGSGSCFTVTLPIHYP